MDGPSLTVLEGTATRGIDVILGLDVLQDWEAEIRVASRRDYLRDMEDHEEEDASADEGEGEIDMSAL